MKKILFQKFRLTGLVGLLIFTRYLLCPPFSAFARSDFLRVNAVPLPNNIAYNNIQMAVQDEAGLLWFVTTNGLYRFDGTETLHFGLGTKPALPQLAITALCPDKEGNLWLGFQNGAAKFDLKQWTISALYPDKRRGVTSRDRQFTAVACLQDGGVYFGTQSGRLYTVKEDQLVLVADLGLGRRKFTATGPALTEPAIENIQEPIAGQIWIATGDGMLVRISRAGHSYGKPAYFKFREAKGLPISSVCYDKSGKCLFAVDTRGIFHTDINALNQTKNRIPADNSDKTFNVHAGSVVLPDSMQDSKYSFLFYLPDGAIGIVTNGDEVFRYIYVYDFGKMAWDQNPKPMYRKYPGELVRDVSSRRLGEITYISTDGGLATIRKNQLPFQVVLSDNNYLNSIRCIYKDDSDIYVGSYQQYFVRYSQTTRQVTHLRTICVYTILPWGKDTLLLGTEGGGLYWYQPSSNTFTAIGIELNLTRAADVYQSGYITALHRINSSLLLEGTTRGIHLIDPVKKIVYPVFAHFSAQHMQAVKTNAIIPFGMGKDKDSTKYLVATNAGVFVTDIQNGHTRYLLAKEVSKEVKQVKTFSLLNLNGTTWMGTSGLGILAVDSLGELHPMEWLNTNLSNQTIYSLVKFGTHILIGTSRGLNVLDLKDSSLLHYDALDGMPSDEFNQSATFRNGQQVYMGTINGIVQWSASRMTEKTRFIPGIHINKLIIADKNNHLKASYNLAYLHHDSFQIRIPANTRYFTLSFNRPDPKSNKTAYYYRLSQTDKWINLGSQREITFNQMTPGNYKLQLAQKVDGKIKPEAMLQIPLVVLPAYYQTLWFKILLGLLVIGVLVAVFRYREYLKNKERHLRMQIAGDLHDEVGSSLTRIWHQAQSLWYKSSDNGFLEKKLEEEKKIQFIATTSQEAIATLSDMVWSVDAQFDTLDELFLRMKSYVYQIQEECDVKVEWIGTDVSKDKKVSQIIRQNLFLLFKEGINNAIKYGDGSGIWINIHFANKLQMVVSNSFDQKKKNGTVLGGRGIENMRRRVQKMNGELKIKTENNTFTLVVAV